MKKLIVSFILGMGVLCTPVHASYVLVDRTSWDYNAEEANENKVESESDVVLSTEVNEKLDEITDKYDLKLDESEALDVDYSNQKHEDIKIETDDKKQIVNTEKEEEVQTRLEEKKKSNPLIWGLIGILIGFTVGRAIYFYRKHRKG